MKETITVSYDFDIEYTTAERRAELIRKILKEPSLRVFGSGPGGFYSVERQTESGQLLEPPPEPPKEPE